MIPNTGLLLELNPTQVSLSIVGSKLNCCQDNKWDNCILPNKRKKINDTDKNNFLPIKSVYKAESNHWETNLTKFRFFWLS